MLALAACGDDDSDHADGIATTEEARDPSATSSDVGRPRAAGASTLLAIVGDAGELSDDTAAVAAIAERLDAHAVFTVGDNDYTAEGRTVAAYAESVGEVYGRWLAAGRFYPIPGDHDYGDACDDTNAEADLDAYLEYFDVPVGPEDETYYDVRIGDAHVFALDTLVECHRDGGAKVERQRRWLAETAGASDAPIKIALLHNPPYSSGASHGSFEEFRWPFDEWGIDLVVAGDDHFYERARHDDVTYVVNGLGGVEAHEPGAPIEGSDVLSADAFGALIVAVSPGSADVSFVNVDGDVVDHFSLDVEPATGSAATPADRVAAADADPGTSSLSVSSSWYWQLQGAPESPYEYDVYDVDLFESPPSLVGDIKAAGRLVVCYFSAGSFEGWRPDAGDFADADLGEPLDGFADERWLDIRSRTVRAVMAERLDRAADLGCDGVEPDNVDGYGNDTGFDLTAGDQLAFNRFLAVTAHDRGLLVGLKNDVDQIAELVDGFDFAVNEQCHEFDECELNAPFLDAGKPVFNAEYADEYVDDPDLVCARARRLDVRTLILPLDLDGSFRISCDDR